MQQHHRARSAQGEFHPRVDVFPEKIREIGIIHVLFVTVPQLSASRRLFKLEQLITPGRNILCNVAIFLLLVA